MVTPVVATADLDLPVHQLTTAALDQLLAAAFTLKATLPPARLTRHPHLDYDWLFNQGKVSSTLKSIPDKIPGYTLVGGHTRLSVRRQSLNSCALADSQTEPDSARVLCTCICCEIFPISSTGVMTDKQTAHSPLIEKALHRWWRIINYQSTSL